MEARNRRTNIVTELLKFVRQYTVKLVRTECLNLSLSAVKFKLKTRIVECPHKGALMYRESEQNTKTIECVIESS